MDKEQRLRAAKVLIEFLRNEDLRAVFDEYISDATNDLANVPPTAATQLQNAAFKLEARKDFLLHIRQCLGEASVIEAKKKAALNQGEPN